MEGSHLTQQSPKSQDARPGRRAPPHPASFIHTVRGAKDDSAGHERGRHLSLLPFLPVHKRPTYVYFGPAACAPARVLGFGFDRRCISPPTTGDASQTFAGHLDTTQRLRRLPPERGCQNQLARRVGRLVYRFRTMALGKVSPVTPQRLLCDSFLNWILFLAHPDMFYF